MHRLAPLDDDVDCIIDDADRLILSYLMLRRMEDGDGSRRRGPGARNEAGPV